MRRDKRCTECGEPALHASRCVKHLVRARERQRRMQNLKRRYHTISYKLQEQVQDSRLRRELSRLVLGR